MHAEIRIEFRAGAGGEPFVYLNWNNGDKCATFDGGLLGRDMLAEVVSHAVKQIVLKREFRLE